MLREKHEKISNKNDTIRNTLRVPLQTELAQELKLGIGFNENWTPMVSNGYPGTWYASRLACNLKKNVGYKTLTEVNGGTLNLTGKRERKCTFY